MWMLFTCLWKLIRILRIRVLSPLLMYVDVILPLALPGLLTYAVPAGDEAAVQEGCRIIVPLRGKRLHTAVVRRIHHQKPDHATEPYLSVLDEQPLLSEETLSRRLHLFALGVVRVQHRRFNVRTARLLLPFPALFVDALLLLQRALCLHFRL